MPAFSSALRSLALVAALLNAPIASHELCDDGTGGKCNTPSSSRATSGTTLLQKVAAKGFEAADRPDFDEDDFEELYPSEGSPLDPLLPPDAGAKLEACPEKNICVGNVNDLDTVKITDTFHTGQYIPHWTGRTCTLGELDWACDREPTDEGAKWLKHWCCSDEESWPDWAKEEVAKYKEPDPNVGKCLCGAPGLFKTGKEVPGWGGRTCNEGELSWACDRPATDGGRTHLTANCCEAREVAPRCKASCESAKKTPWERKCTWKECSGCSICPTLCLQWCREHSLLWKTKCQWSDCVACSPCGEDEDPSLEETED